MVDDVVSMGAALARLHEGRRVEMGDAERLQVRNNRGGGVKIELGRQLYAIAGKGNGGRHYLCPICQCTAHGGMTADKSPPHSFVPVKSPGLPMPRSERLASNCSEAPSPNRHSADN